MAICSFVLFSGQDDMIDFYDKLLLLAFAKQNSVNKIFQCSYVWMVQQLYYTEKKLYLWQDRQKNLLQKKLNS